MELRDLVGFHKLSGVDLDTTINNGEEVDCVAFRLDNTTYLAVEDKDDGFRSYMNELKTTSKPIKNKFKPIEVICTISEVYDDYVLDIYDLKTSLLVLSVGTKNTEDYYPWCQFIYIPQNMILNKEE